MKCDEDERLSVWESVKPKKINFRHYFGGLAFVILLSQLLTGLYMIFYYEPALRDTYKTVQYFNNETFLGAFTRNIHRYGAFLLGIAVYVHFWRSYFRQDYQGKRKLSWITGMILSLVVASFLISGTILPWEWKGYWMMEMFNNWLMSVPLIGDSIYNFFMTSYTPTRNFVIHDIILPITTVILLEYHCLSKIKKRGFTDYLVRHAVAVSVFAIIIVAFSQIFPIPSEDPAVTALPMDGIYVPAPEWYLSAFLLPYWYFPPRSWSLYLFWIPFILFLLAFMAPYINRKKSARHTNGRLKKAQKYIKFGYLGGGGLVCALVIYGFLWGAPKAPWMGCNSCHNSAMGSRMGIPPVTYKDVERNPLLLDRRWMMRHWYQPQVVW